MARYLLQVSYESEMTAKRQLATLRQQLTRVDSQVVRADVPLGSDDLMLIVNTPEWVIIPELLAAVARAGDAKGASALRLSEIESGFGFGRYREPIPIR